MADNGDNVRYSVAELKELMEALSRNKLSSLTVKNGDYALMIEGEKQGQVTVSVPAAQAAPPQQAADAPAPPALTGNVVKSPIVGTFYAAPSPDKEPYARLGQSVGKGDVLFIIESMKLMNEVTSEFSGTVSEILVENGQAVEYGQPIIVIE